MIIKKALEVINRCNKRQIYQYRGGGSDELIEDNMFENLNIIYILNNKVYIGYAESKKESDTLFPWRYNFTTNAIIKLTNKEVNSFKAIMNEKKIDDYNIIFSSDYIQFIKHSVQSNIKELNSHTYGGYEVKYITFYNTKKGNVEVCVDLDNHLDYDEFVYFIIPKKEKKKLDKYNDYFNNEIITNEDESCYKEIF